MKIIERFDGEYAFLSNFYPSRIPYDIMVGQYAPTVEHAFQAIKTQNPEEEIDILSAATPGQAKRLGRRCQLRPDWEQVKDDMMRRLITVKFTIPELRQKLLDTGDAILIEGNNWHDNYWGICGCDRCRGNGQNKLGQILMQVREEIKNDTTRITESQN